MRDALAAAQVVEAEFESVTVEFIIDGDVSDGQACRCAICQGGYYVYWPPPGPAPACCYNQPESVENHQLERRLEQRAKTLEKKARRRRQRVWVVAWP